MQRSLERLQLDFVDCWMMHWPGPAWEARGRPGRRCSEARGAPSEDAHDEPASRAPSAGCPPSEPASHGPWEYAADGQGREQMAALRAETWRAMEHALSAGKARSIGVSNFTVAHLEALKRTAVVWPPSVNQVECHPLYQQEALRQYCTKESQT